MAYTPSMNFQNVHNTCDSAQIPPIEVGPLDHVDRASGIYFPQGGPKLTPAAEPVNRSMKTTARQAVHSDPFVVLGSRLAFVNSQDRDAVPSSRHSSGQYRDGGADAARHYRRIFVADINDVHSQLIRYSRRTNTAPSSAKANGMSGYGRRSKSACRVLIFSL